MAIGPDGPAEDEPNAASESGSPAPADPEASPPRAADGQAQARELAPPEPDADPARPAPEGMAGHGHGHEHEHEHDDELPPGERASTVFLVVVSLLSCAADLVTKGWAHARLAGFDGKRGAGTKSITVIEGHLDFIFAQNPGGAWSFMRSLPDGLRRPFFLFVSAAAIIFIVSIYRRIHRDQTAMKWGLPLALGGAMGNLVDRIRYGWVIDFIDVYVTRGGREHHWPTFNVADIAIVIGVVLMGMSMIASSRRMRAEDPQALAPAGAGAGAGAGPASLPGEAPPPAPPPAA